MRISETHGTINYFCTISSFSKVPLFQEIMDFYFLFTSTVPFVYILIVFGFFLLK